jgi:uncharacterized protein
MPEEKIVRLRPTRPCPICGKPSAQQFHPFCSARCADVDLNRWLSGAYVIPARADEASEEESAAEDAPYSDDDLD